MVSGQQACGDAKDGWGGGLGDRICNPFIPTGRGENKVSLRCFVMVIIVINNADRL